MLILIKNNWFNNRIENTCLKMFLFFSQNIWDQLPGQKYLCLTNKHTLPWKEIFMWLKIVVINKNSSIKNQRPNPKSSISMLIKMDSNLSSHQFKKSYLIIKNKSQKSGTIFTLLFWINRLKLFNIFKLSKKVGFKLLPNRQPILILLNHQGVLIQKNLKFII